MKKILTVIIVIIVLIIASITILNKTTETTIEIGGLFPLTGGLAVYGEAAQKSAELAIKELNANGERFSINYQDHQCNPTTALAIFKQLSELDKIDYFTTTACSGTVLSIAPNLNDEILIGNIVTTPKITNVSENVFRNWASDAKEAELFADFIKEKGYQKVGIVYEQTDYAEGLKISLESFLPKMEITSEGFDSNTKDIRTQLIKLKDTEVIFISPQTESAGDLILKQLTELNITSDLIVNDNIIKSLKLVEEHSKVLEGCIGGDFIIESNTENEAFLKKYEETYGEECPQDNICFAVYDSVYLIAKAIEKSDNDIEKAKEYLQTTTYDGISGKISFDKNNDRANTEYTLLTVKNGSVVNI
jgi:branched-chain amino acid transport system substrate-binding protein